MIHSPGYLRKKVRELLAMAPGYYMTDPMIIEKVNLMIEPDAPAGDIRAGVEWNVAKGYAETRVNEDTDEREWCITKRGIAKESVK